MFSDSDFPDVISECYHAGATHFLTEPFLFSRLKRWFFRDFLVIFHWLVCLQRREDPEAFRMGTLMKRGTRRGAWWVGGRTASRRFSLRSAALVRWCWVGSPLVPVRVGGQTPA